MNIRLSSIISLMMITLFAYSQQVSGVYKINDLLKRIDNGSDTLYVVNFWATWCKPCVQELPDFEAFAKEHQNEKIKVLLVSLDFKEEKTKRVDPFLQKNKYTTECVLLDEVNGNDFIDKIDKRWSGAIPATFATYNKREHVFFAERKLHPEDLKAILEEFNR